MAQKPPQRPWRSVLPWLVSAALLVYVFGYATDWERLRSATDRANLPLFLFYASADRLAFFLIWTYFSAMALRRFVVQVPVRSVIAIRGGSELARVVSNPLSDAAFFVGMVQLAGGRIDAVVASAFVPVVSHLFIMLVQMTIALPFLPGGIPGNPGVTTAAGILWGIALGVVVLVRLAGSRHVRFAWVRPVREWFERFSPRELFPFVLGFAFLALFDVHIQWLASHAFGIEIGWAAIAARIPLVYLSFAIPTLGNFGTRELTWAALFSDFGSRDALIAYAFAINAIFLVLNALIGVLFLPRALQLIAAVRRAQREGDALPKPILHDPTDQ
jgi:hypothetical protein